MTGRIARAVLLTLVAAWSSAAADDTLVVTGDRVNVRGGPGTEHAVVGKVVEGQVVIGRERQGAWYHIDPGGGRAEGWVHQSYVRLKPAGTVGDTGGSRIARFRRSLETESRRVLEATGSFPFVGAEDLGDGVVAVVSSEDWFVGGGDLSGDAWRLYQLWKAENGGRRVVLAITDTDGNIYITVQDTNGEPLLTVHH
ncbi:MAG: SH3 domain-containing protein [Alphaproteobacteria bacterium]